MASPYRLNLPRPAPGAIITLINANVQPKVPLAPGQNGVSSSSSLFKITIQDFLKQHEELKVQGSGESYLVAQPMSATQVFVPMGNIQVVPLSSVPQFEILRFVDIKQVKKEVAEPVPEPKPQSVKCPTPSVKTKSGGKKFRLVKVINGQEHVWAMKTGPTTSGGSKTKVQSKKIQESKPKPTDLVDSPYKRTLIDYEKCVIDLTYKETALENAKGVFVKCPFGGCEVGHYKADLMETHFGKHFSNRQGAVQVKYFCPVEKCNHAELQGSFFNKLSKLRRHYLTFHADKKYRCTICRKALSFVSTLTKHEKVCKAKFSCSCGKRFNHLPDLKRHTEKAGHTFDTEECRRLVYGTN